MSLKETLKADLKDAMRQKNIIKRDAIRSINTMIKQIEVDERKELNDEDIIKLILKGVKQREDAIEQFNTASRDDLIQVEQKQIDIFEQYLPKKLTDEELELEIKAIIKDVQATSLKDIGKIMNPAKQKIGAGADGKRINEMVKKLLS